MLTGLAAARAGVNQKQVKDNTPQDQEAAHKTKAFLELWGPIKQAMRDQYIEHLKKCPVTDDLRRYRLSEALNILDAVEMHAQKVHSDASFNLNQVIKKDFAKKRGLFR